MELSVVGHQDVKHMLLFIQFLSLLKRLGLPTTKARLSYFDFLRAIDDGRASKYAKRRYGTDTSVREPVTWQTFEHLTIDKIMKKLQEKVTVNYDSLNSVSIERLLLYFL